MKQNARRRAQNRIVRGSVRVVLRAIRTEQDVKGVLERLSWTMANEDKAVMLKHAIGKMYSIVDSALKKGIIHRNKAARHKAQIARWAQRMAQ